MELCILNMLPLKGEEAAAFEAAAPQARHLYAGRRTVTPEQLAQAQVIMGWVRPGDLAKAGQLKWLHSMWAGVDEYLDVLPEGVTLTSSAGSNSQSVAEHMLASLLSLCRKLPQLRDNQRAHRWEDPGNMRTLTGAHVLVVGAGHIGSHFAGLCKMMGARTTGLKRTVSPLPGFDQVLPIAQMDELLPQADVVALTLPDSPATRKLMNGSRLASMKEDAILLSDGRGTVLDQEALVAQLSAGRFWGVALDVTDPEPLPPDSPLWDAPRLLITPHCAGGMRLELTRRNCIEMALDNLRRYVAGQPLHNLVRP